MTVFSPATCVPENGSVGEVVWFSWPGRWRWKGDLTALQYPAILATRTGPVGVEVKEGQLKGQDEGWRGFDGGVSDLLTAIMLIDP